MPHTLAQLPLKNHFASLPQDFHAQAPIHPLEDAHTISVNESVVNLLGLAPPDQKEKEDYARYFGGGEQLTQAKPVASVYAGHQFGIFVSQLGDGRCTLLGEALGSDKQYYDITIKGAGPNEYSRAGDGRAVLRSTIREYLCGEAMHALGIASTRALAMIGSSTPVQRETLEAAAILVRVARTHVRFGSFEYFHYRGEHNLVKQLADFVIEHYHPDVSKAEDGYIELYKRAVRSTAVMLADWQAFGFAHGVMNTDNMSILGETMDYGPYGFMEEYQPEWICNHSDTRGRYAWYKQPSIALWNLAALGQALGSLIPEEKLKESLRDYESIMGERWLQRMCARMDLDNSGNPEELTGLIGEWLDMLQKQSCDYSLSFRALCVLADGGEPAAELSYPRQDERFEQWFKKYQQHLRKDKGARRPRMESFNPLYVLRKHLAHQAITAAEQGDYTELESLMALIQSPYQEVAGKEAYAAAAPEWADKIELSCSS